MMSASTHHQYAATEELHQGGCATLYRALRGDDSHPVVLKVLDPRRCGQKELERLRHEYEIGTSLDLQSAVRPLGLETYQGMPALVLEDYGGRPLEHFLGAPMSVEAFLELAVRIAGAVSDLHREGVVHKDIKPQNILVHPTTLEVKLADFGLSTRLPREQQAARPPQLIEGSLPYLSPEQTGRMNRAVDSRTDLYSLGVTFFQMLTGRLPFEANDPLEWVYCHVARVPPSPSQLVPQVPEAIARIVMKLLAKMVEDRYQTARGLRHDLARCLEQWRQGRRIEAFTLGERDTPDRLRIPQTLFGRDEEITALLGAFERVVGTGSPEVVLVSGYSGIGKSSLVNELHKPNVREQGLFVTGKFDQLRRDIPYSTIAQAFRQLVLDLLLDGEERVAEWRKRLQAALGVNGQLVLDVIPRLELLIGKQPPVPELPLSEAQNRFHMVFRQFLGVFACKEHPLILFLDDLQWADSASLKLLADVLTHPDTRYLLAIGAYRENEVTAAHPLMMMLAELRKGTAVRELVLTPLSHEHLGQLVAGAMLRSPEQVEPLTLLIGEKTAGNPFFAIQFLTSLHDEGLLRFDPQALEWNCDVSSVRARAYTDNVVELMVSRLKRLPAQVQETVKLAACAGSVIDAGELALLRARSEEETRRDLWELAREGLLDRSGDTYRFSHDRVRQAAYALIPEDQRGEAHLTIGRLLLAHTPAGRLGERVFDLVSQLNRGASLIEDGAERIRLAELDLLAGQKAKASTAYGPAARYLAAGMAMLPADVWQARYELAYALHLERARCEYLAGSFADAERCLAVALQNARTRADKAACFRLRIEVYTTNGEIEKVVTSLLECVALFGIGLEPHPPADTVKEQYAKVMRCIGSRSIEELLDLPPMSDPDVRALVEALVAAAFAVFFYDTGMHFAVVSEAVRLSVQHGNAPCSVAAYGIFGMMIGQHLGNFRDGYRFGKLGHDLVERDGLVAYRARSCLIFGYCISFWTHHVSTALPYLEEGLRAASEAGDLNHACYCCCCIISVLLAQGESLDEVDRQSARLLGFARKARYSDAGDTILIQRRLILRLRGTSSGAPAAPGQAPNSPSDDEGLDTRILGCVPTTVCWYHIRKLQEHFILGAQGDDHQYDQALSAAAQARDLLWTSVTLWEGCEYSYYLALTLSASYAHSSPRDREDHLRALKAEAERHRAWAESCPENFLDRYALVSAELARIEARVLDAERLYEQAIQSARDNGFVQNEAIAYERASEFYRARGFDLTADTYLREARACYARWGADRKVRQIDQLHPRIAARREDSPGSGPIAPTVSFAMRTEQLDLLSVVKASHTISSEVLVEKLVVTLVQVALEQGGARKGYLILARGGALSIEAEATLEENGVSARILPSLPVESSPLLPASLVHYARLTREPVIVDDAAAGRAKWASDAYLGAHRPRSVLCLPIARHESLVGLLYLENDLVAGAFTPDRLTALTLLASQAAISMENALLLAGERVARAAAEQAERRSALLAKAGALFSESLDYEETLDRLGRLCVQSLADWCVLDIVEGREVRRLAGACRDPAKEPLLERLRRQYPARWDSHHPAATCLRTGKPVWVPESTDDILRSRCEDDGHMELVRRLGTRSFQAVPLVARGQILGALSMGSGTPGRYGPSDLDLAQEVALRAAIAIDNARLHRETQRAVRVRDEFLMVASHELRTPMTSLTLSLRTLQRAERSAKPDLPDVMSQSVELAARQGKRLNRLIGDLLDVSRIEASWLPLTLSEVELGSVVRDVAERFEAEVTDAACSLTIQGDALVTGHWDPSRIDQVVTNLLSNAVKFGAGKPIEIFVGEEAGRARLVVRDHGMGIDPAHQARIFERFERAVPVQHYGGLGLGLHISRRIVEAHGGTLRLESRPGAGAAFTVELPCAGPGDAGQPDRAGLNAQSQVPVPAQGSRTPSPR
jgi:predicted ATPase/signal transduction histidine kinase/tRNA A-37 threonylcarbamoyl transferase component Bud32